VNGTGFSKKHGSALVYSPAYYYCDISQRIFPTVKFRRVAGALKKEQSNYDIGLTDGTGDEEYTSSS